VPRSDSRASEVGSFSVKALPAPTRKKACGGSASRALKGVAAQEADARFRGFVHEDSGRGCIGIESAEAGVSE